MPTCLLSRLPLPPPHLTRDPQGREAESLSWANSPVFCPPGGSQRAWKGSKSQLFAGEGGAEVPPPTSCKAPAPFHACGTRSAPRGSHVTCKDLEAEVACLGSGQGRLGRSLLGGAAGTRLFWGGWAQWVVRLTGDLGTWRELKGRSERRGRNPIKQTEQR